MKDIFIFLLFFSLSLTACGPSPNIGAIIPPYVDTGINPESWTLIPAGPFPSGQHDHMTIITYDYEMMITNVTNEQYAHFLNQAIKAGEAKIGEIEIEAGERVWVEKGVGGFYPGEPYDGYKHEEEILSGDKIYRDVDLVT